MMNRNNSNDKKTKVSFSSLITDNKFVFLLSLLFAVAFWVMVSMSQTTEIERVFTDVRISVNIDENSVAAENNLEIFGNADYFADVTVKGYSYLVNASDLSNSNINLFASTSSVVTAGTYDLPVSGSLTGISGDVQISSISVKSVKVSFDERVTKSFALTEQIEEGENYALAEGLVRENPRLSLDKIDISGPSKEIAKITSVKAYVKIDKLLSATESFEADIIAESSNGVVDLSNLKLEITEPVYVSLPICKVGTYETAVDFAGVPQAYRSEGVEYSVYPAKIDVSVQTGANDTQLDDNNKILIGTIDFSKINNTVNRIVVENQKISSDVKNFTVTIDMSSMAKRWLEIPVDVSSVTVPENVTVLSQSVASVQIVGPSQSVMNIDKNAAYAVPVFDGQELTPGKHTIPAKIILRTLTDSWVHGTYTVEIEVK